MVGTDGEGAVCPTLALARLCLLLRGDHSTTGAPISESLRKTKSQHHSAPWD